MDSLRILVADDHPVVRLGLRALLSSNQGWEVCGEASDGREAIEMYKQLKPDVVILDICLPRLNGVDLSEHPKTGQRWSGQNRPTEEAGDSVVLPRGFLRRQVYFRAATSRTAFENMTVMEEAIEHGGDGRAVNQQFAPIVDWSN